MSIGLAQAGNHRQRLEDYQNAGDKHDDVDRHQQVVVLLPLLDEFDDPGVERR